jgi:hypothetical protein
MGAGFRVLPPAIELLLCYPFRDGQLRCGLTGVAADGGAMKRAEALASLVSTARSYLIRRSFYEAGFVKSETLGRAPQYDRANRPYGND